MKHSCKADNMQLSASERDHRSFGVGWVSTRRHSSAALTWQRSRQTAGSRSSEAGSVCRLPHRYPVVPDAGVESIPGMTQARLMNTCGGAGTGARQVHPAMRKLNLDTLLEAAMPYKSGRPGPVLATPQMLPYVGCGWSAQLTSGSDRGCATAAPPQPHGEVTAWEGQSGAGRRSREVECTPPWDGGT